MTQGRLLIDFALHDAGLATRWALAARKGDTLDVGGPRGSAVIPTDFDWFWLIGDETALPAIGRWVEEAPPGMRVTTFVAVAEEADRQIIPTRASWNDHWIVRDGSGDDSALLRAAMARTQMPPGEGFIWIAAEAGVARALRSTVLGELRHPREWTKAAGYWIRGKADGHDRLED